MRFRFSGRDDPDGAAEAFCPDHHQDAQERVAPHRDYDDFVVIEVFDGQGKGIIENGRGVGEIHAMLTQVRGSLGFIPFESHDHSVHTNVHTRK